MSTWTAEKRKNADPDVFCGPNESYPLEDQADLDAIARLYGKAADPEAVKRLAIARAKKLGLRLPPSWQESDTAEHSRSPATFALGDVGTEAGDTVRRTGLLFTAGAYPDKQFEIDTGELDDAVTTFIPCPINLEHMASTPLAGKLGHVERIWREGNSLFGEVALPIWLDKALEGSGRKVSATWDRATKQLRNLALVNNPRVPDAALFSAYAAFNARHDTPEGQTAMQHLHDVCAANGAVCSQANAVHMHSRHEHKGMQSIHDLAKHHGARCVAIGYPMVGSPPPDHDGPDGDNDADDPPMATMSHTPTTRPVVARRNTTVSKIGQWFGLGREARELARNAGAELEDESTFTIIEEEARTAADEARVAAFNALEAERDAARRERDIAVQERFAATAQRLQGEAAAFADGLIVGNKILPAERESVINAMTQAGMDDAQFGSVSFSNGSTGSRVETFKALYANRPAHTLTQEHLKTAAAGGQVVFNNLTTPDPNSPDSMYTLEDLLAKTQPGKAALKARKNGTSN